VPKFYSVCVVLVAKLLAGHIVFSSLFIKFSQTSKVGYANMNQLQFACNY